MNFGCNECNHEVAVNAWEAFKKTTTVNSLIDESHFSVRIKVCKQCQQNYLSVFTETIDWQGGEDPQLWSIMPINQDEINELTHMNNEHTLIASIKLLSPTRQSLCLDWPKGSPKNIFWRQGIVVGFHD